MPASLPPRPRCRPWGVEAPASPAHRTRMGAAARRMGAFLVLCALLPLPSLADFPGTIARVKRSVVAVGTYVAIGNPRFRFLGTGFVVGDGNRVVTNAHVVASAPESGDEKLVIAMPGSGPQVVARPVRREASDLDHDLALLRFDGPPLPALSLGDSSLRHKYSFHRNGQVTEKPCH